MKRTYLGEFEEIVLLITAQLSNDAYGVSITESIHEQTGRKVTISAVHATLSRMEDKGLVKSRMGGATAERGGRRKRIFTVTAYGAQVLKEVQELRSELWERIPNSMLRWKTN